MSPMLSHNGIIHHKDAFHLHPDNRAFRYGDGVFETIRVENGVILWLELHFRRLFESARVLRMNTGSQWSEKQFELEILSLYKQNHPDGGSARVRYSLFRNAGGLYTPQTNTASWLIESDYVDGPFFTLNARGLETGLYTDIPKSTNMLSALKGISAQIYVMASIYKRDHDLGDCILVNDKGGIAEASSSNIFLLQDKQFITPPIDEGCVDGVMRRVLIELFMSSGINISEQPITKNDLLRADEVFLTNSIQGIRWVSCFMDKKYQNHQTAEILKLLNKQAEAYCLSKTV